MAVFRVNNNKNYTVMSNTHLRDKELSLKGKGLLSVMLSLHENWDYSINGLAAISKEGVKAIRNILNELEENGYLVRTRTQDDKGRFTYIYDIFETPQRATLKPHTQKGHTVKGHTDEDIQLNTNILNTNELSTKELIIKKDKKDKENIIDKYDKPPAVNLSIINKNELNIEVHSLTAHLIDRKLIKSNDTELYKYNDLFEEVLKEYEYNLVCKVINYVIARMKDNIEIENKFNYFKSSLETNLRSQTKEYSIEWPSYNWQ